MATSTSIRLLFEPLRSLVYTSITSTYMGVGTALDNPARMIIINNYTDAQLTFSFDGVEDHIELAANSNFVLDISANKTREGGFYLAQGDRLYVKESETPTEGGVYFSVLYGKD